jgi:hypothetical protein
MSWLPPPAPATSEHRGRRPWRPPTVQALELAPFSYLVVDEIVGGSLGLVLSGWPDVDEQGRLRFGGTPTMLGADRAALQRFLDEHRRPTASARRPLRIGDAFAVRVIPGALAEVGDELAAQTRLEPLLAPEEWIEPPVYDVSADAREAAKAAFYAAVAPVLTPRKAAELAVLTEEQAG